MPDQRGTSVSYFIRRFRAEGLHQLADAVEQGKIAAKTCAIELGWLPSARPKSAELRPQAAQRRERALHVLRQQGAFGEAATQRTSVTPAEAQELRLGPCADDPSWGSLFPDRADLLRAWEIERERLIRHCSPRRPMAWWNFDSKELGLEWPGLEHEKSYLWKHGVLSEPERLAIEQEWLEAFNEASEPGFVEYSNGKMVTGARARRLLYRNEDIPHELVTAWTAERRRRRKSKEEPARKGKAAG
jgi:hypothetical protein